MRDWRWLARARGGRQAAKGRSYGSVADRNRARATAAAYGGSIEDHGATKRVRGASASPWGRVPWITLAVCGLSVAVLAASSDTDPSQGSPLRSVLAVIAAGGRSTSLIADAGESWRLLTCHFVHTSVLHLGFNVAFLFPVGGALEQIVPRRHYAALLIAAAVGSSLCSLLGTPQVSAGASGLVFAVLGAAVTVGLHHGPRLPRAVRLHFGGWVLPFLVIVLAVSANNPGVDHWSHLGGLATGLVAGLVLPLRGDSTSTGVTPWLAVAVAAGLLVSARSIATRGRGAQPVQLEDGTTFAIPSGWRARFGPVGELQFTSAGGLAVLAADRAPGGSWQERLAWYTRHRLATMTAAGQVVQLAVGPPRALTKGRQTGFSIRYAYQRDGIAMVRDVFFLASKTVLSFELPRVWAAKYDETRAAIVGSVRMTPAVSGRERGPSEASPLAAAMSVDSR